MLGETQQQFSLTRVMLVHGGAQKGNFFDSITLDNNEQKAKVHDRRRPNSLAHSPYHGAL